MRGLICAHMLAWIRSHLDAVCILRCIRPHQAGPEHNCLSKFNANDHNNILSTVIRGDLSGSKQETQQLKGTKTLPSRDHLLTWHQRYRHDPIQAGYTCCTDRRSLTSLLHALFMVNLCVFICTSPWVQTQNALSISVYLTAHLFFGLWGAFFKFVCVLDICLRGLGDNIRFLKNHDNNC